MLDKLINYFCRTLLKLDMNNCINCMLKRNIFLFFLIIPTMLIAQLSRDTIYLDYNWSICEKPVASYYRICAIHKEKLVFYKGPFEDYYMDGKIEMIGAYDDKGRKAGNFISYYRNGNKKEEGDYGNDRRIGLWSFYSEDGKLILQLFCTSNHDFVPHLMIDKNGDTLVKNGNGKFVLYTKDYPGLFTKRSSCRMEGAVVNGNKEGTINYFSCNESTKLDYSEVYKKGEFRSSSSAINQVANIPFATIELTSEKLECVESFYHINPVFGNDDQGGKLALDYIINKNFYGIASKAANFRDNYQDFYDIVGYTINETLNATNTYSVPFSSYDNEDRKIFNRVNIYNNKLSAYRPVKGNITITIDTTGYVSNSVFKGNFQKEEINKINYYLSVIYGLKPYTDNGMKYNKDINLKVYSNVDSSKVDDTTQRYTYLYLVENADKTDMEPLPLIPDIEAKFPGGQAAWIKYLQKNLDSNVPADNRAPNGNYTVIVSFNVDERGNLSGIKALNDPGYGTAAEAVRVIKTGPAWSPAVLHGKNVASKQKQAITFQIAGE